MAVDIIVSKFEIGGPDGPDRWYVGFNFRNPLTGVTDYAETEVFLGEVADLSQEGVRKYAWTKNQKAFQAVLDKVEKAAPVIGSSFTTSQS